MVRHTGTVELPTLSLKEPLLYTRDPFGTRGVAAAEKYTPEKAGEESNLLGFSLYVSDISAPSYSCTQSKLRMLLMQ